MARFWLCAVTILSMCNLLNCDVCGSLCSCYAQSNLNVTDCQGRGLNTTLLLNRSFPKTTEILYLQDNAITLLPGNVFSGLRNLRTLNLRNNEINQLPQNVFSGLTNLQNL
ncbi:leucine-rich repeat and transmembrane domain-containing protein 1-like [Acropora millepora]|uniref:leucine-rich repeat and transmembrane domain-containing protein 1-like n=1 Tax=Acropora millepora TaxID=45264 RepID=UPI001CF233E1|nr:leucine-rich repeat and transmembrane domain-containing protein 1-like [Acropora millepora]